MAFISDDGGESYNRCHCELNCSLSKDILIDERSLLVWSNFEIGNMDLWRGEAYTKFFDYLDKAGGFYYEVSHETLGQFSCLSCTALG